MDASLLSSLIIAAYVHDRYGLLLLLLLPLCVCATQGHFMQQGSGPDHADLEPFVHVCMLWCVAWTLVFRRCVVSGVDSASAAVLMLSLHLPAVCGA